MIIRMCVVCRDRLLQQDMLRLQCQNNRIQKFNGVGRSFYICKECINSKKLDKIMQRICKKDKNQILEIIREIKEM